MAKGHLLFEKPVAESVEFGDGVGAEVDGQGLVGEAESGVAFQILQNAETVYPFGTRVGEVLRGMEVAAQGLPKVIGGELLTQEGGHGGFDIMVVEGGEGVVGGFDGGKSVRGVEGVARGHDIEPSGDGRTRAKGDTLRGASLGADREMGM